MQLEGHLLPKQKWQGDIENCISSKTLLLDGTAPVLHPVRLLADTVQVPATQPPPWILESVVPGIVEALSEHRAEDELSGETCAQTGHLQTGLLSFLGILLHPRAAEPTSQLTSLPVS